MTVTPNPNVMQGFLPYLLAAFAQLVAFAASTSIMMPSPIPEYSPILSCGTRKEVIMSVMKGKMME